MSRNLLHYAISLSFFGSVFVVLGLFGCRVRKDPFTSSEPAPGQTNGLHRKAAPGIRLRVARGWGRGSCWRRRPYAIVWRMAQHKVWAKEVTSVVWCDAETTQ